MLKMEETAMKEFPLAGAVHGRRSHGTRRNMLAPA
jgi:hypothetical protein